jgi:FAD/FMN-containing dehydrogenase
MHPSKRQGILMEHPLQVEEFLLGAAPPVRADALNLQPPRPGAAEAAPAAPLPPPPDLSAGDVLYLRPGDPEYAAYLPASNKRTQLSPSLRAVGKTERAASVMVDWVRANNLNFAVRCGGHSYEGFSQSKDVVIDVRGLSKIAVDKTAGLVTVGSGATLYSIYQALAAEGLAIPAGSCPTVGISGHLTGGGFGLLGRAYGLTCDHLRQLTLIDSQARPLQASATSNPDLFWGCRGGGGGSFGVATEFTLSAVPLKSAVVFGVSWALPQSAAARVFQAWQSWAPNAPKDVTSIMKVGPAGNGRISMRCIGQSTVRKARCEISSGHWSRLNLLPSR